MHYIVPLLSMLALIVGLARADTYWVTYTGDAFPETEGWTRYSSDPPAERWLEDGKLFIDSRADWFISESYGQSTTGKMTPGPGETFRMTWRVRVDEIIGVADPGVMIESDDDYAAGFVLGKGMIYSVYESGHTAAFAPDVFHQFTLETSDMRAYKLYIDGVPAVEGTLFKSLFPGAFVGWGDISSHRSLAAWDRVEYGIIPEPAASLTLIVTVLGTARISLRPWRKGGRS